MSTEIPNHDSQLDSIDRREQEKEKELDDYSEEDLWRNSDEEDD